MNTAGSLKRALASEIDFSASYKLSNEVRIQAGYSLLFDKQSLESIQNRVANGLQQWGWAMLVINPKLL